MCMTVDVDARLIGLIFSSTQDYLTGIGGNVDLD